MPVATNEASTAERILDVAEGLVQVRGFNGFSYAHVAGELGITKASLHYHFPGKGELGEALIERYATRFADALGAIDRDALDALAKLHAYAELYSGVLRGDRMCLCGMLAAEYETLPEAMGAAIVRFFDANEAWLAGVLDAGRDDGSLAFAGKSSDAAQTILAGLEGAMLVARPYHAPERFEVAADRLLGTFAAPSGAPNRLR